MIRTLGLVAAAALVAASPAAAQDAHQHDHPPEQQAPEHEHDAEPAPAPHGHMQHQPGEHGAMPQDHMQHDQMQHDQMQHDRMQHDRMQHDRMQHDQMQHDRMMQDQTMHGDHAARMAAMTGLYGPYAMTRDASGTSWQPDAAAHGGVHVHAGGWMVMTHALLNGVYDWQEGPRGDEKAFLAGMLMATARRDVGANGTLALRAMVSPDPWMGKSGYPLLLAAGESADGATPLVDRQHPHDLFMELAASYAHRVTPEDSVFFYAGLPGEPAFGPPAFMHRPAAIDSPEAPITHHWFDSTHITFGVLTAGWVHGDWKLEASRFRGREPDESRFDIETGDLDSTSARASWNPTANLALQVSWADVTSPEALEPDHDEERFSASALYTRDLGDYGSWSGTLAFARKDKSEGEPLDAWLAEAAYLPNERWTVFARAEFIDTDELGDDHHGDVEPVARLSAGAIRDWRIAEHVRFGLGALAQTHRTSDTLSELYGSSPAGAMAFARLKIG